MSEKKFTKGPVKVHMKNYFRGGEALEVEVPGYILGTLAVTRNIAHEDRRADGGTGDWERHFFPGNTSWAVTHVPTGWGVMLHIDKLSQAQALARALEDIIPADSELMTRSFLGEDWYPKATEAMKAWKAGL